ncbi:MAG: hypothetical protein AAGN35_18735 [Bacteroidota bacterium]
MTDPRFPLLAMPVGISISESSDMEELGFGEPHLRDFLTEVARYLLAAGASLAYGGDLRSGGYTETLFSLVNNYKIPGGGTTPRIRSYLAWPIHLLLDVKARATLQRSAEIHALPAPELPDIDPQTFLPPKDTASSYVWCRSLTAMRRRLARDNAAQVLMGGRTAGYKGKYPGLVEEAYECMRAGIPVFLIGAFGGATRDVILALTGQHPESLTEAAQTAHASYRALLPHYNAQIPADEPPINYDQLVQFFRERGIAGLNNGLSEAENFRMFTSPHLVEIVSLLLKGLKRGYAKN